MVLLGPSGCGKTTLLKMVNRLIAPDSGRVLIDGEDVRGFAAPALRRRIGYVIQQTGLFPHMRVEANVAVVPTLLDWDKARTDQLVDRLMELVGLPPGEYRRRYPAQLSGGEQQRVGLARALAADPTMLLMDSRLGQTVLFVTHDIDEAVRLADEIVIMSEGRVIQAGAPLEVMTRPADRFVADLVGADDVLRRLSLIPVVEAILPVDPEATVEISSTADLRTALGLLMEHGTTSLRVVDGNNIALGAIDLGTIQNLCAPFEQAERP